MASPTCHELDTGCANRITDSATTNPSGTRRRASDATTSAMRQQPVTRRVNHLVYRNVIDAWCAAPASPLVQTGALRDAGHRDVERRQWTVPLWLRRSKQRDDRCAHGARDVQRSGV